MEWDLFSLEKRMVGVDLGAACQSKGEGFEKQESGSSQSCKVGEETMVINCNRGDSKVTERGGKKTQTTFHNEDSKTLVQTSK